MLVGGVHISGSWLSKPEPRPFSIGFSAFVILVLAVWGWVLFAFAFAALADLGSAAMNFISTNISASIS